jgi:AraC-like DNA-binding protein
MYINIQKPSHKKLQQYIDFFYFLKKNDIEAKERYLTFPNNYVLLSFTFGNKFEFFENHIKVYSINDSNITTFLTYRYNQPLLIEYLGAVKEFTIVFKPMGINAFSNITLADFSSEIHPFIYFNPFVGLEKKLAKVLNDDRKCFQIVEDFLMPEFKGFSHPFLQEAIQLIENEENYPLGEISDKLGISSKTLIKHFKSVLGKTPNEFRKIYRFRTTLSLKENLAKNLSEISYNSNYFDQSHMIKDFKKLTGHTPNLFFKNLKEKYGEDVNWMKK